MCFSYYIVWPAGTLPDYLSDDEREKRLNAEIDRARRRAEQEGKELIVFRKPDPPKPLTDEEQSMHEEVLHRLEQFCET